MRKENGNRCALCQRHQRLETVDGTVFWMEFDEADRPRLCMDSRSQGGGLNVLCVKFCPICGRSCETDFDVEGNYGEKTKHPAVLRAERGQAGTAEVSRR